MILSFSFRYYLGTSEVSYIPIIVSVVSLSSLPETVWPKKLEN